MNINQIINLLLDGDTDRAIVMLLREQHRQRSTPIRHAGPPGTRDDLPPMVPLRARRSKAIEVACPTCGAKAGKPCLVMTRGGGANATVLDPPQPKEGYHSKRIAKAKAKAQ